MTKAVAVDVPEDLDIGIADWRQSCRDLLQNGLDHQVARHGLAQ